MAGRGSDQPYLRGDFGALPFEYRRNVAVDTRNIDAADSLIQRCEAHYIAKPGPTCPTCLLVVANAADDILQQRDQL